MSMGDKLILTADCGLKPHRRYRLKDSGERGVIAALFIVSLPVLLGLVILAIDIGNLYLARMRMDKVSRVAAATALNIMALRGWGAMVADPDDLAAAPNSRKLGLRTANAPIDPPTSTNGNQTVREEMRRAALETMAAYYPKDFNSAGESDFLKIITRDKNISNEVPLSSLRLRESTIEADFRYAVPTLLLGAFDNLFDALGICERINNVPRCWISNTPRPSAGYMKPANIFMLLDTSGSMGSALPDGRTKKQVLDEAVGTFVDMFNPYRDRIAVIDFGTSVKTKSNLTTFAATEFVEDGYLPIKTDVADREVGGQTNPCDALIETINGITLNSQLNDPNTAKFVLLFTDGAPNVYRLNFCDDDNCSASPPKITSVIGTNDDQGWYGWTVKWGERLTYSDDGELCESSLDPGCDPFFNLPQIANQKGILFGRNEVASNLKLTETLDYVWTVAEKNKSGNEPVTPDPAGGFRFVFRDHTRAEDNYRWFGPSYLVHASFQIPAGISLIDKIPVEVEDSSSTPLLTCGPASRGSMPGAIDPTTKVADKYNHSFYFASRVVDSEWQLGPDPSNPTHPSKNKADKVGLSDRIAPNGEIESPIYFSRAQPLKNDPAQAPGCLTSLNARVPKTDAKIYVGDKFLSNTNDASIERVGEIVKTAELPYYCAIRAADVLREKNVAVFVVGLGPSASEGNGTPTAPGYGTGCTDPLQNALDFETRKDHFLRRLALAPESLENPADFLMGKSSEWDPKVDFSLKSRTITGCANHPLEGETVEIGYGEELENSRVKNRTPAEHGLKPEQLGAYYGSNDPSQLRSLFAKVAKEILLRLAS